MNTEKELEEFIHQQLQKLPDRPAPEDLVGSVLTAIAQKENRPWWRQPFTSWPTAAQGFLFAGLLSLPAAVAYLISGPAEQVSLSALYERALSLSWVGEVLKTLGNAFLMMFDGAAIYWLGGAGFVVLAMYGACIAGGVALYRITSSHSLK